MGFRDIFGNEIPQREIKPEPIINGLCYIKDWITDEEEDILLFCIDNMPWETTLKRRVQQYGYRYDYRKAKTMIISHKDNYLGELPKFLSDIGKRLVSEKIFEKEPEEVLINEYLPGQGIENHVDCVPCFDNTVVSLSLGSQCVMDFKKNNSIIHKVLDTKSILVIKGEARYEWSHGIRQNKTDIIGRERVERERRVSITFRNIIE